MSKNRVSLNDISQVKRKSLMLKALVRLKRVQILAPEEKIFVEDMIKKSMRRDLNIKQIEIIEKLSTKYKISIW